MAEPTLREKALERIGGEKEAEKQAAVKLVDSLSPCALEYVNSDNFTDENTERIREMIFYYASIAHQYIASPDEDDKREAPAEFDERVTRIAILIESWVQSFQLKVLTELMVNSQMDRNAQDIR